MNRPWMPFYIADYLADTGHLSTVEHGAYLLLIFHYWQNSGVPDEDARLARIARVTAKEWKTMRSTLVAFFDQDWKHPRIERELADSNARYERRAAAGREGGNAKAMLVRGGSNARPMPKQKAGNVGDSRGGRDNHNHNPSGSPAEQDRVGLGTGQGGGAQPGTPDNAPFGRDGEGLTALAMPVSAPAAVAGGDSENLGVRGADGSKKAVSGLRSKPEAVH